MKDVTRKQWRVVYVVDGRSQRSGVYYELAKAQAAAKRLPMGYVEECAS